MHDEVRVVAVTVLVAVLGAGGWWTSERGWPAEAVAIVAGARSVYLGAARLGPPLSKSRGLLQALNTGHGGSRATLRANEPPGASRGSSPLGTQVSSGLTPAQTYRATMTPRSDVAPTEWCATIRLVFRFRRVAESEAVSS